MQVELKTVAPLAMNDWSSAVSGVGGISAGAPG